MRILIRYDEIGLKSRQVRKKFEDKLIQNIQKKTDDKVFKENNRIFLESELQKVPEEILKLRKTPGIASVSPCMVTSSIPDDIYEKLKDLIEEYSDELKEFALKTRRTGGHDYTSMELAEDLGQRVVDDFGLDVDLEEPDLRVYIEVRNKNSYLFTEKIDCIGGLPVGIEGTSALLLEDRTSMVAGVLMMKRGCEIIPLVMDMDEEELREPMRILKLYDPDIKTVKVKNFRPESIEKVLKLFKINSVVSGVTSEDIKEGKEFNKFSVPVLKPNCSMSLQEVLERYNEFRF